VTRFAIFGTQLTQAEIDALRALAAEAGCPGDKIAVVTSICDPDPNVDDEVILLLGTPSTCADPNLETDLARAANGARRVIWIWPESAGAAELPPSAAKYSYSTVSWNAEKLRAVVADDDVMCFETATGEPIPKVPTERNLCAEDEEKKKAKAK
jgi:hypothetical protein